MGVSKEKFGDLQDLDNDNFGDFLITKHAERIKRAKNVSALSA